MSGTTEQRKWGLIVVGGGISGLSTGIVWALHHDIGKEPVLIVEKQRKTGGFVTTFKRRDFFFDTCQMMPDMSDMLAYMGVFVALREFEEYYMRLILVNPKTHERRILSLPSGVDRFRDYLATRYPDQAEETTRFLDHAQAMSHELFSLKLEPSIYDIMKMLVTCPKTVRNAHKTFREYFKQFPITHPEIKEIFDAFAVYSCLPMGRVSAVLPVTVIHTLLRGVNRPRAGYIDLPQKMEARYLALGGALRLKTSVRRIMEDGGHVTGVILDSNETLYADNIVTTVDTQMAMTQLIGLETLARMDRSYAARAGKVRMTTSSMNISLGLDDAIDLRALGMDCGYNLITTGGGTFDELFDAYDRGETGFSDERFHIGVICPSLTTGGRPALTIRVVPMAMGDWHDLRARDREAYKREKNRIADFFIEKVERYLIPELRAHIVVRDIATPATFARFSGSPTGAIYDMAPYPENFGRTRLKMRTPIRGCYHTKFAHGVYSAVLSGFQVNDMILDGRIMNGTSHLDWSSVHS